MASLPIAVHHFLVCQSVTWEGIPGPDTKRTLEGVGYKYSVEPGAEPPFELPELWTFFRIVRVRESNRTIPVRIKLTRINPDGPRQTTLFTINPVSLSNVNGVRDIGWPLRPCPFIAGGLFEFRLQFQVRTILGPRWKTMARDFLTVEEKR